MQKYSLLITFILITTVLNAQDFYSNLWQGNVDGIKKNIEEDPEQVHVINRWGNTPLQAVVRWGQHNQIEIINALIENDADVNQLSNDGRTALHYAVLESSKDVVMQLIQNGADETIIDSNQNSVLYYAVLRRSKEFIDLFYKEDVLLPIEGERGRKVLQSAVSCGHLEIADNLIKRGANIHSLRGDGGSLLHCAAEGNLVEIIEFLSENGLDINAFNNYYYTPLHLAVIHNNSNAVKALIKLGAILDKSTNIGKTPYHLANENELSEIKKILIESGANTNEYSFKVEGKYFGQEPPGSKAKVFAPGIVSTMEGFEFAGVFTPENTEYFFTQRGLGFGQRVRYSKLNNGKWSEPDFAPFTYDCFEFEPGISPDGEELYYGSRRPIENDGEINNRTEIWKVTKKGNWKDPVYIGSDMMYVNVSANKTLYTTSLRNNMWGIIKREFENGKFGEFISLGDSINYMPGTAHPYIAPDESYIIFDAQPKEYGENGALFISFKKDDGTWTKAKAFGDEINFGQIMTAWVSHDQKYLFFNSIVDGYSDIYWIDASVINRIKEEVLK